ncbi:MAG TPA: hypothetical protein VM865_10315, partial [Acidobacteriaceae bacterium]|nr:hypothetical protein [Acidobacteriaceae bacterium]
MNEHRFTSRVIRSAIVPFLATAVSFGVASAQTNGQYDNQNSSRSSRDGRNGQPIDNRQGTNSQYQGNPGRESGAPYNQSPDGRPGVNGAMRPDQNNNRGQYDNNRGQHENDRGQYNGNSYGDRRGDQGRGQQYGRNNNFRFGNQDRGRFQSHFGNDVRRWH